MKVDKEKLIQAVEGQPKIVFPVGTAIVDDWDLVEMILDAIAAAIGKRNQSRNPEDREKTLRFLVREVADDLERAKELVRGK